MNTFMKKVFLPNYTQFTTTQKGFRRIPHLFYLLGRKHLPADRHVMTTFPFRDKKDCNNIQGNIYQVQGAPN